MVVVVLETENWVPFPPKKKWIRHYLEEYPPSEKNFPPESASSVASSTVPMPTTNVRSPVVPCIAIGTNSSQDVISSTNSSFPSLNNGSCTSSPIVAAISSFSLTPSLSFNYSSISTIDNKTEASLNIPQTHVSMSLATGVAALRPRHLQPPMVIQRNNDPFMGSAIHPPRTLTRHAILQQPNPTSLTTVSTLPHRTHSEKSNTGAEIKRKLSNSGTREVHNKLEKNRRAHLKECFELLKGEVPAIKDEKKPSNLTILRTAIRYVQILQRREQDLKHELEKLGREKIVHTQRLSTLKKELSAQWEHIDFNSLIPDSVELPTIVGSRENSADYNRDYENEKMVMSNMDDGSSHVKSRSETYYGSSSPTGSCSISPLHISSPNVNASTLPDTLTPQIHIVESASMALDKLSSTSVINPIHFLSASALRMLSDPVQQSISLIKHDGGDRLSESATLPKMAVHSRNTFTFFNDSFQKVNAITSNSCSVVVSPSDTSLSMSSTRLMGTSPTRYPMGLSVPAAFSVKHKNVSSLPAKSNFTQSTPNSGVITTVIAGDRDCTSVLNMVPVYSNAGNLANHSFVSTQPSLGPPMLISNSTSHLSTQALSSQPLLKTMSRFQSINGH